ncbi:MAG: hypothetical protein JSS21_05025 [Proteobacteria bacterium]|nr:hypothetical protein [Pseudomonadota bacterium]
MKRFVSTALSASICMMLAQGSNASTPQTSPDMMTITSVRSVPKGSADFDRMRTFLLEQSKKGTSDSGSVSDLSLDKLGKFTIRSVRYRPIPAKPTPDHDAPVVPTDEKSPAYGDSWSVSTCAGNLFQNWTWAYGDHGWALTGRAMHSRFNCNDETAGHHQPE